MLQDQVFSLWRQVTTPHPGRAGRGQNATNEQGDPEEKQRKSTRRMAQEIQPKLVTVFVHKLPLWVNGLGRITITLHFAGPRPNRKVRPSILTNTHARYSDSPDHGVVRLGLSPASRSASEAGVEIKSSKNFRATGSTATTKISREVRHRQDRQTSNTV